MTILAEDFLILERKLQQQKIILLSNIFSNSSMTEKYRNVRMLLTTNDAQSYKKCFVICEFWSR